MVMRALARLCSGMRARSARWKLATKRRWRTSTRPRRSRTIDSKRTRAKQTWLDRVAEFAERHLAHALASGVVDRIAKRRRQCRQCWFSQTRWYEVGLQEMHFDF